MTKSPVVTLLVNDKLCTGIVDTGSGVTLIKRATAVRLGIGINQAKALPRLISTNGSPLKILGMAQITVSIGNKERYTQWISVVPDAYLDRDLLLGCDILGRDDLTWKAGANEMIWGGQTYDVAHVRGAIRRIRRVIVEHQTEPNHIIQLKRNEVLQPYQRKIMQVKVKQSPGTELIVTPDNKITRQVAPILVQVDDNQNVPIVIENSSKIPRRFKPGAKVAQF